VYSLRDRVCFGNICINTLHKGVKEDDDDDDDDNNNNTKLFHSFFYTRR
jgi:hypothetical protein